MNLLLDTHIWIWSKLEPKRLGKRVTQELSTSANDLWLSPVSVWEAIVLMQKGRIRVDNPFAWVERAAEQLREAPLTQEIVRTGLALPLPHADPADRFLAATAKVLNLTLVTGDQRLLGLGDIRSLANR
ncbi:MAG TPA: type II toxin-antitoxin system VapC family toxin [Candidatus Dormibacteraeota bacterium]|nr:type II toxin-antitoxin system VapC family toxin [Candidatus Dormibacteraeota bacterium]